jgi:DNA-binding MarR family transcriptional regulator
VLPLGNLALTLLKTWYIEYQLRKKCTNDTNKCIMPINITDVHNYFAKLQLEPEIADIYMALYSHGPQSLTELARSAGIERTRLYRLMDALTASSLVEVEQHYKRTIL